MLESWSGEVGQPLSIRLHKMHRSSYRPSFLSGYRETFIKARRMPGLGGRVCLTLRIPHKISSPKNVNVTGIPSNALLGWRWCQHLHLIRKVLYTGNKHLNPRHCNILHWSWFHVTVSKHSVQSCQSSNSVPFNRICWSGSTKASSLLAVTQGFTRVRFRILRLKLLTQRHDSTRLYDGNFLLIKLIS